MLSYYSVNTYFFISMQKNGPWITSEDITDWLRILQKSYAAFKILIFSL